ncbi:hypothetical protein ACCD07_27805, partial [Duganella sp. Dugasp56]
DAPAPAPAFDDIRDRLLYALANATHAAVEAGDVDSDEADLVSVRLCGFPAHTGGAAHFVEYVGKDSFVKRSAALKMPPFLL